MTSLRRLAISFWKSEDGPTVTEYAIMLALIVLAAVGAIGGVGYKVDGVFTTLDSSLPTGS
jgi:Flp pilus assembly pilin Flp